MRSQYIICMYYFLTHIYFIFLSSFLKICYFYICLFYRTLTLTKCNIYFKLILLTLPRSVEGPKAVFDIAVEKRFRKKLKFFIYFKLICF